MISAVPEVVFQILSLSLIKSERENGELGTIVDIFPVALKTMTYFTFSHNHSYVLRRQYKLCQDAGRRELPRLGSIFGIR